ncbi:TIGR04283 family arsenosugar biosynthesis glycosyltransferase [Candidatus Woesearchaeota archaeon]|nr:TIGR04283 family arsenosugar biosynthesis glycosyltransferase [Candidatus Woesearchaeota archaeon]
MISVIIPAYNEEKYIEKILLELKKQEGDFEIIVVDGGSKDKTAEIAAKYAKVYMSEKGRAVQMNYGAGKSTGEVLLFLHADTILPENGIKEITQSIEKGFDGGRFKHSFDHHSKILKFSSFLVNLGIIPFTFGDMGWFITKEKFNKLGGYKKMGFLEDVDFVKRFYFNSNITQLNSRVITSARRFLRRGIVKQLLTDFYILILYLFGVSEKKLSSMYKDVR